MNAALAALAGRQKAWRVGALLLLSSASFLSILLGTWIWSTPRPVEVVVRVSTTTDGNGQIFPLTSAGYTEQRSTVFPMIHDGLPHEYSAALRELASPGAFRIDPGSGRGGIIIHSVEIKSDVHSVRLDEEALRRAVIPLNHLSAPHHAAEVSFHSQGDDPYLEVSIPRELLERDSARRTQGLLLALVGVAVLLALLWQCRSPLWIFVNGSMRRKVVVVLAFSAIAALVLLGALQAGCDGICSWEGMRYGGALLLASVALGAVGAASLQLLGLGAAHSRFRIFIWIAVGQLALVAYVFLRSALYAILPFLPLTTLELTGVVLAAALYLWSSRPPAERRTRFFVSAWIAIEVALLVAICLVVADRELPRLVMLSSDPDTHAYLARQIELGGAIPRHGETAFSYPAGTAALGFLWSQLSLLDVRNSVTALPLMQSFIAALMLGEALALRTRAPTIRLLVMLTTLGVTAAGFLIPLYINYSHMEGAGRQMAIATAAVVPALLLSGFAGRPSEDGRMSVVVLASLFVLAALNPISVVVPTILVIAWILYRAFAGQRIKWWALAIVALPILMLLDPYYFQLIAGSGLGNSKITISETMTAKSAHEVLVAWLDHQVTRPLTFLLDSSAMGTGQGAPLFVAYVAAIAALRFAFKQTVRIDGAALLAIVLSIFALIAADGLFSALRDDRRFYLLSPYYLFTLGQFKILLITTMAAGVILLGRSRRLAARVLIAPAVLLILLVRVGMHDTQRYALEPRADYCGSLGCATTDDIAVMTRFAEMIRQPDGTKLSTLPRVLVPNSVHDTPKENWVFPITGARALPFYDVPPIAFFYYQGDDDYTTEAYKTHVCRDFDREWLAAQGIGYVFLPSVRGAACLDGMEHLPATEEILVRSGNSYLLRIRPISSNAL